MDSDKAVGRLLLTKVYDLLDQEPRRDFWLRWLRCFVRVLGVNLFWLVVSLTFGVISFLFPLGVRKLMIYSGRFSKELLNLSLFDYATLNIPALLIVNMICLWTFLLAIFLDARSDRAGRIALRPRYTSAFAYAGAFTILIAAAMAVPAIILEDICAIKGECAQEQRIELWRSFWIGRFEFLIFPWVVAFAFAFSLILSRTSVASRLLFLEQLKKEGKISGEEMSSYVDRRLRRVRDLG